MKIVLIIFGSALVAFFVLAILVHELNTRTAGELKKLSRLLSSEWKLVSWAPQPMGWCSRFEAHGRRFEVSSHRGDVEIVERVGGSRRPIGNDGPKSPEEIYDLLTKAVA